jgi:cytochrome c peroxidase
MPDVARLPHGAGPFGTQVEREAWDGFSDPVKRDVSRVFTNLGKAVAAYENTLYFGPSRLDRFIDGVLKDDPAAAHLLNEREKSGLRIFMHKGRCITCHNGPLFTDAHFHNTGIAPREPGKPDRGREGGIPQLLKDEFNCLGPFSGVAPDQCDELRFLAASDPHMLGSFKTPSLRNVAERAPYMHAGQLRSLRDVVLHYTHAPAAAIGATELKPVALSDAEIKDLVAFLGTLSGPILERPPIDK